MIGLLIGNYLNYSSLQHSSVWPFFVSRSPVPVAAIAADRSLLVPVSAPLTSALAACVPRWAWEAASYDWSPALAAASSIPRSCRTLSPASVVAVRCPRRPHLGGKGVHRPHLGGKGVHTVFGRCGTVCGLGGILEELSG